MSKQQSQPALYLTKEEREMFDKLPAAMKAGWTVETETLKFVDSDEKRAIRVRNLKFQNPAMQKLQSQIQKAASEKEALELAQSIDFPSLSQDDVLELAFAWGPEVFTDMIAAAMPLVSKDGDFASVANLAMLRHGLLLAMTR